MSTISSLSNNTYMMYKIAAQGMNASSSVAATGSSQTTSEASLVSLLSANTRSDKTSTATAQLNSLWSGYLSANASAAQNVAVGVANHAETLNNLLSTYSTSSKTFYTQFNTAMSNLSQATAQLKTTNFAVTGATDAATAANTKTAVGNVENFVAKYNDSIDFFTDNAKVSGRVSSLAASFSDTTYRAGSLKNIGIAVDSATGKMTVDETKLTAAMKETPDTVSYVLGSNGLAGKADAKTILAESQSSKLFPSISSMLGTSLASTQSLYSARTLNAMSNYTNIGTLLDMYF